MLSDLLKWLTVMHVQVYSMCMYPEEHLVPADMLNNWIQGWDVADLVERLPSTSQTLGLIPHTGYAITFPAVGDGGGGRQIRSSKSSSLYWV